MARSIATHLSECPVFKIAEHDTNKFVILADSREQPLPFVLVVEIFDGHGATPPNIHKTAYENFYILKGEGEAVVGDERIALQPGSCLTVPPGVTHQVINTAPHKLYVLTMMSPDEAFSTLIRSGVPATLDAEDEAVLLEGAGALPAVGG